MQSVDVYIYCLLRLVLVTVRSEYTQIYSNRRSASSHHSCLSCTFEVMPCIDCNWDEYCGAILCTHSETITSGKYRRDDTLFALNVRFLWRVIGVNDAVASSTLTYWREWYTEEDRRYSVMGGNDLVPSRIALADHLEIKKKKRKAESIPVFLPVWLCGAQRNE